MDLNPQDEDRLCTFSMQEKADEQEGSEGEKKCSSTCAL